MLAVGANGSKGREETEGKGGQPPPQCFHMMLLWGEG